MDLFEFHDILIVGSGSTVSDAIDLHRVKIPNIVFIDLNICKCDACFAIETIRKRDSRVKIIFVSEKYTDCECEKFVYRTIPGPFDFQDMMNLLEELEQATRL